MRHFAILLFLALFGCSAEGVAQTTFGSFEGDFSDLYGFGWGKRESYDVAMRVDYASLIGKKVVAMRFPMNPDTHYATDFKVWLTHELSVANSAVNPDICIADAAYVEGEGNMWVEGRLATPYVIDGPLYAGYSLTMTEADKLADMYPVLIIDRSTSVGCWIHTTRSYRKFQDFNKSDAISSALQLVIDDETVPAYGAVLTPVADDVYVGQEDPTAVSFRLSNNGLEAIKSIDVTITGRDKTTGEVVTTTQRHHDLGATLYGGHIGRTALVSFMLEPAEHEGDYDMSTTVNAVNGNENLDPSPTTQAQLHVIAFAPHRRPLVEEYTGTWCGWCPRGYVGMEHMKEIYGDEFVGIAYHNDDKMAIMAEYPASKVTFPTAWMDRAFETDPYQGNTNSPFGIQNVWLDRCTVPTEANINIDATLSTDGKSLVVTSTTRFVRDVANANTKYRIAYFMTADGFTDVQKNYYDPSHAGSLGSDMELFLKGNDAVKLTFYDVVVATSDLRGVSGSIPTTVKAGREYTHKHTFRLADAKGLNGSALMTKGITPNAVAVLIDTETGEVVNAAKQSYASITGIDTVLADPMTDAPRGTFDLYGRRIELSTEGSATTGAHNGIVIKDGRKILVK